MTFQISHRVARTLLATAALFAVSGCNNDPFEIQLVNKTAYTVTEVLAYPAPACGEAPGPESQINRMPQDDSGATMALLPDDEVMLPWLFPQDVYEVSVTCYDSANQVFRRVQAPYPYDLTFVKSGYPVVLRTVMDTNNTPNIEVEFITRF
jgi:hypothetical protein